VQRIANQILGQNCFLFVRLVLWRLRLKIKTESASLAIFRLELRQLTDIFACNHHDFSRVLIYEMEPVFCSSLSRNWLAMGGDFRRCSRADVIEDFTSSGSRSRMAAISSTENPSKAKRMNASRSLCWAPRKANSTMDTISSVEAISSGVAVRRSRSEEHTSELQSREKLVCSLL